ncbi:hypothetical protein [Flammeovirga agarivorans]|uniref:Uncharacterized protein n=1 Tax=Flammeovirga agarivorans TaxID=2726742 RepID=A0A7X8SRK6_9BACT|nr:hypothetical protein [Flammeovirga agarivorans]NLR95061.1 hypothetical protein [Flammeovirga agarivorans]
MEKQAIKKNQYRTIELLERHSGKNVSFGLLIMFIGMIIGFIYSSNTNKGYLLPMVITIPIWMSYFFSKIYFLLFKHKIQKNGLYNKQFQAKAIELKLIHKNDKERLQTLILGLVFTSFMIYLSRHYYYEANLLSKDLDYTTGEMIGNYEYGYYVNDQYITDKTYKSSKKECYLIINEGDEFIVSYSPLDYEVSKINFEKPTQDQLLKYQKELELNVKSNTKINSNCLVLTIYEEFGIIGLAALFKYYSFYDRLNSRHIDELEEILSKKRFQETLLNCN